MRETKLTITVPISSEIKYPIIFGKDHWLDSLKAFLSKKSYTKIAFIIDETVLFLWKTDFLSFPTADILPIPSGEESKTITTAMEIAEWLLKKGFDRQSLLVAIGGGVIGDLCGFVASIYMRGIGFIQMPTTILSIVDSSIGGKTGVDTPHGKNLIGSFHFPVLVISDTKFLRTLSEEQKKNGLVEMLKHALICDKKYYARLIQALKQPQISWEPLLWRSCQIKSQIVQKDPTEKNFRQILNFGHTFGHAIEHASSYELLHGFSVAWGILAEAYISMKKGYLDESSLHKLQKDFQTLGLLSVPFLMRKLSWEDIQNPLFRDKKNKLNRVNVVLINKIGNVVPYQGKYSHPIEEAILKESFQFLKKVAEELDENH